MESVLKGLFTNFGSTFGKMAHFCPFYPFPILNRTKNWDMDNILMVGGGGVEGGICPVMSFHKTIPSKFVNQIRYLVPVFRSRLSSNT